MNSKIVIRFEFIFIHEADLPVLGYFDNSPALRSKGCWACLEGQSNASCNLISSLTFGKHLI